MCCVKLQGITVLNLCENCVKAEPKLMKRRRNERTVGVSAWPQKNPKIPQLNPPRISADSRPMRWRAIRALRATEARRGNALANQQKTENTTDTAEPAQKKAKPPLKAP